MDQRPLEFTVMQSQNVINALTLGMDFENRCIYIFGEINAAAAYRFIAAFKWLDRTEGPIHIVLNSPGGSADDGFAIHDAMRTANNPTVVEVIGIAASAAVPILQAGTIRLITPESKVMIHQISYDIAGSVGTAVVLSLGRETEKGNKRYAEIIATRTGQSIKNIESWCEKETYFDAQEALKYGFVDEILETRPLPKNAKFGIVEIQEFADRWLTPAKKKRRKKHGKATRKTKGK